MKSIDFPQAKITERLSTILKSNSTLLATLILAITIVALVISYELYLLSASLLLFIGCAGYVHNVSKEIGNLNFTDADYNITLEE